MLSSHEGGTLLLEDQTGTVSTLNGFGGEINYQSTATISALTLNGARFDAIGGVGSFTVSTSDIYKGSQFIDPSRRCVMSAPVSLYFDPSADLQFGASVPFPITVQN